MSNFGKKLFLVSLFFIVFTVCASVTYAYESKNGTVNSDDVNVRSKPNSSSGVITTAGQGSSVTVIGESNGWYNVRVGDKNGWIFAQYVTVKAKAQKGTSTVTADGVNLREKPSADSKIISVLDKGSKVSPITSSGNWVKVKTSNGSTGWVSKAYVYSPSVTVSRGDDSRRDSKPVVQAPKTSSSNASSVKGQELVEYAKNFLGVRYVYGGSSPSGFDCSGFTSYVFRHFGIGLERVAADQGKQGTYVDKDSLKPGDLVLFDTNGGHNYINHAGIYIGGGSFIHASSGSNSHKVVISSLSEGFYVNAYMTARRFIQ